MSVDIHDVITCATFCDDRLRSSGVARGRISRFPIDLLRRPYNTLALPCECVTNILVIRWETLKIPSLPRTQLVPTWTRTRANDMLSNDGTTWLSNNELISFIIIYLLSIIVKTKVTVFDSQLLLPSMLLLSCRLLKKYQVSPHCTVDSLYNFGFCCMFL